jgi:nucleotide-binding universal stress UspA family protein
MLVPLDGSPLAELALAPAIRLAVRDGAPVHLVRAHQKLIDEAAPGGAEWEGWAREQERQYLASLARQVREAGVSRVTAGLLDEPVAVAICSEAQRIGAERIVMASHGRTGFSRLWFGSIADAVVRHATTPVFLVRAAGDEGRLARPVGRVLIPLDGSEAAEAVIPHALSLAGPDGAGILIVRVVVPAQLPAPALALVGADTGVGGEVLEPILESAESYVHDTVDGIRRAAPSSDPEGIVQINAQPAAAILRVAEANQVDVIAMSTRGRGASRLLVGSVADKVLRGTSASLLLIQEGKESA